MITLFGWTLVRASELDALLAATTMLREDTARLRAAIAAQRDPETPKAGG